MIKHSTKTINMLLEHVHVLLFVSYSWKTVEESGNLKRCGKVFP